MTKLLGYLPTTFVKARRALDEDGLGLGVDAMLVIPDDDLVLDGWNRLRGVHQRLELLAAVGHRVVIDPLLDAVLAGREYDVEDLRGARLPDRPGQTTAGLVNVVLRRWLRVVIELHVDATPL